MAEDSSDNTASGSSSDAAPSNFQNRSPFQKRSKKKDPLGAGVFALGIVALVACLLAVGLTMIMSAG